MSSRSTAARPTRAGRRVAPPLLAFALVGGLAAVAALSVRGADGAARASAHAPARATERSAANVPLRRLVGQHLVVRMEGTTPSPELLARIRRGEVGGVILFSDNIASPAGLAKTIGVLQRAARAGGGLPLLTAVDQEGGSVKRLPQAPPTLSPAAVGAIASQSEARRQGQQTGSYLRGLGINVNLAPVLDVPDSADSFLEDRAYGRDAKLVARVGAAFASGMQHHRVAATAKHFPGLGSARANTDSFAVSVSATRAQLELQLVPFAAAIDRGIKLVMVSNASYPALDSSRVPALLSRRIVTSLLRDRLGFEGVVITDSMQAPGPSGNRSSPVLALRAGVDLLLHTGFEGSSADLYRRLLGSARAGALGREDLERSYERIAALKRWLAAGRR